MNIWQAIEKMKEGKKISTPGNMTYLYLDNNIIKCVCGNDSVSRSAYNDMYQCLMCNHDSFVEYVEPYKEIKGFRVGDLFQLESGNKAVVFCCYVSNDYTSMQYGLLGACEDFRGYSGTTSVGPINKVLNVLNECKAVLIGNITKEFGQLLEQKVDETKK